MKFEYWKAKDGKWYWHLKGANGEPIAQGEGYAHQADCQHAIGLVKSSAAATVFNLMLRET